MSKLRRAGRTTILRSVRAALQLREGDEIAYRIERNQVLPTKMIRHLTEDCFAVFCEWSSQADQVAYSEL